MRHFILLILIGCLISQHIPSDERGDETYRRSTIIAANQVQTTVFNSGITGRTGANVGEIPYEWPINSGHNYIAMTALAIGSMINTEQGERRPIVTITFRQDQMGNSRSWEPVPEYLDTNSTSIANSTDWNSWPECWPNTMDDLDDPGWCNSWSSYFGKNYFIEGQEIYFRISDDKNYINGSPFYPDTTDYTRLGAGLLVDYRVLEWDVPELEDMVLQIYSIKNDGTTFLDSNAIGIWIADLVGGDGDSSDDIPSYDLEQDLVWSEDSDGIGNQGFGGDPVGIPAFLILDSPDQNGLTSIAYDPAGAIPTGSDNSLWNNYLTPGNYWEEPVGGLPPGDYDLFIGSGYFSLEPGEQKDLLLAVFLSEDEETMYQKAETIRFFYESGFSPNPSQMAQIELELNPGHVYANGESTAAVEIYLHDYFGNSLANKIISLTAGDGNITDTVLTDIDGLATGIFSISYEPENGTSLITATSTDPDYGTEISEILIPVLPAGLSGDPYVPIPFDLTINRSNQANGISWNAEILSGYTPGYTVEYDFFVYRNDALLTDIDGSFRMNEHDSFWSRDSLYQFEFRSFFSQHDPSRPVIAEYRIIWDEFDHESTCYCSNFPMDDPCLEGSIYCTEYFLDGAVVNFHVQKNDGSVGSEEAWIEIPFAFWDIYPSIDNPDGIFNGESWNSDIIVFLDGEDESGELHPSWMFRLKYPQQEGDHYIYNEPQSGDTAFVSTRYYFDDINPEGNMNCYQVSTFFPLDSDSDLFPPGTESLRSEPVCDIDEFLPGDVNLDSQLDILDIVQIVSIIMGVTPPMGYQLYIGDVSGDGALDILDIVAIISMIMDL